MKMIEKRRYQRKGINVKAQIVIYSQVLNLLEEGTAIVRNISPEGGLISDLEIPSQSIPLAPFVVGLKIKEGTLTGIQTTCSMTRLSSWRRSAMATKAPNGKVFMGLKFDKIGEKHRFRLNEFVRKFDYSPKDGGNALRKEAF